MNHGMNPELDYVIDEAVAKAHKKLQKAKAKTERKERKERKKVRPAASLDVLCCLDTALTMGYQMWGRDDQLDGLPDDHQMVPYDSCCMVTVRACRMCVPLRSPAYDARSSLWHVSLGRTEPSCTVSGRNLPYLDAICRQATRLDCVH